MQSVRASQRSQHYLAKLLVNMLLGRFGHRGPVETCDVVNVFDGLSQPGDLRLLCGLRDFHAAVRAVVANPPAGDIRSAVRASARTIGWRGTAHRWPVVFAESCVRRPSSMPFASCAAFKMSSQLGRTSATASFICSEHENQMALSPFVCPGNPSITESASDTPMIRCSKSTTNGEQACCWQATPASCGIESVSILIISSSV